MPLEVDMGILIRLLSRTRGNLIIDPTDIQIPSPQKPTRIPLSGVEKVERSRGWFRSTLSLQTSRGPLAVRWLRHNDAERVCAAVLWYRHRSSVRTVLDEWVMPGGRSQYLTASRFARWIGPAKDVVEKIGANAQLAALDEPDVALFQRLVTIVSSGETSRQTRNKLYVDQQRQLHAELFQSGQGYPLNSEQVEAILHDEDRNLVVAGAGTGKTSTIVGKVAHVLAERLAEPGEVLMVAFTRKASEEMSERMSAFAGAEVAVRTFHALGLEIIAKATGKKPSLSKLAEDEKLLQSTVQGFVRELINNAGGQSPITSFLAYERVPYRPIETFRSLHHYHQYNRGHDLRTLRDEKVKSVEESIVANWLTLHGIKYVYEHPYEHDTASVEFRQYRPDFYLPDHKIYIEHFGITRDGRPAPIFADPQRYMESMKWKLDLHRRHKTTLVQTFSYQVADRSIFGHLERELSSRGVPVSGLPKAQLVSLFARDEVIQPFTKLVLTFLNLYKGNAWTRGELTNRVKAAASPRVDTFMQVFEQIFAKYENALKAERAIDFNDMITMATTLVRDGRYSSPYRYVLVDEFQDIARGRSQLIQAMLAQVDDSRLFCVGDDWQSIYRFTGSDIDLMVQFAAHFGFTKRTDLTQTHRFGSRLLQATSKFILANPQQLRKSLKAASTSTVPAVEVVSCEKTNRPQAFKQVLARIAEECRDDRIDVLVIGRYHFLHDNYDVVKPDDPRITLRRMSVHQAKGLEAQYTVVLDVLGGKYGFPTEMVDDPLLELVLAQQNAYPNAEERRLFYVALTRSKIKTYVITDDVERSVFIDELESGDYAGLVIPSGARRRTVACPTCNGGCLVERKGDWGAFWGCSNYPGCQTKARACQKCGVGAFVRRSSEWICANQQCGARSPICPTCRTGALVERNGRYGPFVGCSEWRSNGPSCGYTAKRR